MDICRIDGCRMCSAVILLVASLAGCGKEEPASLRNEPASSSSRDSLVMTSATGTEIWFTLTRQGQASDGTSCLERGLEVRRDSTRIPVPLLYTGTAPVFINESTMRAELWKHCRPVDTYLVDLRTGRPVREQSGSTR